MTLKLANPTKQPPRGTDSQGSGAFGATRNAATHRDNSSWHSGLDLICTPGQMVVSPIRGLIVRRKRPYGNGGPYDDGVLIEGNGEHKGLQATLLYMSCAEGLWGKTVSPDEIIGIALDISKKYPAITPHVHLTIKQDGKPIDPTPLIFGYVDPPSEVNA